MHNYRTVFGSLDSYTKGDIAIIDDDRRHYAFSNVFEVASKAAPYEKTVVAKHLQYAIEVLRAEGQSNWFTAPHDEFALIMDGEVRIDLIKLDTPALRDGAVQNGAIELTEAPRGRKMGWLKLRRGHQALLPAGAAYRFGTTDKTGVIVLQTLCGPLSVEKWAEICLS